MAIAHHKKRIEGGRPEDTFDHSFTGEVFSTLGWCAGFAATGLFTVGANGIAAFSMGGLLAAAAVLAVGVGFFYLASRERKKEAAAKEIEENTKTIKLELAQGQHMVNINLETPRMDYTADQPAIGKFTSAVQTEREQQKNIAAYVS